MMQFYLAPMEEVTGYVYRNVYHAGQFVDTCHMLMELGYDEVNLNLGCPSATVVKKAKGSGFLNDTEMLDRFFEEVFQKLDQGQSPLKISVKTRIGLESAEAFIRSAIMEIFLQRNSMKLL